MGICSRQGLHIESCLYRVLTLFRALLFQAPALRCKIAPGGGKYTNQSFFPETAFSGKFFSCNECANNRLCRLTKCSLQAAGND